MAKAAQMNNAKSKNLRFWIIGGGGRSPFVIRNVVFIFHASFLLCASSIAFAIALAVMATQAARAQSNLITLAPDGAWTWFNDPRALYDRGTLYFGYVRDGDSRTVLSAFEPRTGRPAELWTSTLAEKDDHDNPGLLLRQDGRILAVYSRH